METVDKTNTGNFHNEHPVFADRFQACNSTGRFLKPYVRRNFTADQLPIIRTFIPWSSGGNSIRYRSSHLFDRSDGFYRSSTMRVEAENCHSLFTNNLRILYERIA